MNIPQPYILGFSGSPHPDGAVNHLLDLFLQGAAQAGAQTRLIHLYELAVVHEPGLYSENAALEVPAQMPRDGIVALYPEIKKADGIVLGTPTYWANMSGIMKDFIDHLTALENENFALQGKIAAFIAESKENEGGVEMAAMSMVAALGQMGVLIPPEAIMWYPGDWVKAKETVKDWAAYDAPRIGRNMVKLINLLREHPINWNE